MTEPAATDVFDLRLDDSKTEAEILALTDGDNKLMIASDTYAVYTINGAGEKKLHGFVDGIQASKNKFTATVAPAVTDDSDSGYAIGSLWMDNVTKVLYKCDNATVGAAVWTNTDTTTTDAESLWDVDVEDAVLDVFYRGANLFENGNFADWTAGNPDGWDTSETPPGSVEESSGGGECRLYSPAGELALIRQTVMEVGKTYRFDAGCSVSAMGSTLAQEGANTVATIDAIGSYGATFVATNTIFTLKRVGGIASDQTLANASLREILPTKRTGQPEQLDYIQNFAWPSQDISDSNWVKNAATIDDNTGIDSPIIDEDTNLPVPYMGLKGTAATTDHYIEQLFTIAAGTHKFHCAALNGNNDLVAVENVTTGEIAWVDLTTGVVSNASTDLVISTIITPQGVIINFESEADTSSTFRVYSAPSAGVTSYLGDDTIDTYLTALQLCEGPLAAGYPYVKTTAAPETGRSIYRPVVETVAEERRRVGTFELADASGNGTGIWETPVDDGVKKYLNAHGNRHGMLKLVDNGLWEHRRIGVPYWAPNQDDGTKVIKQYFDETYGDTTFDTLITSGVDELFNRGGWVKNDSGTMRISPDSYTTSSEYARIEIGNTSRLQLMRGATYYGSSNPYIVWATYTLLAPPSTNPWD